MERRGYLRGEIILICDKHSGMINLSGYRRSEKGIEYYNELLKGGLVYIYRFIGYYIDYSYGLINPPIVGIAIGNIQWV